MKTIEDYIQFWIDNWFKRYWAYDIEITSFRDEDYIKYKLKWADGTNPLEFEIDVLRFITSKDYLQSIERWTNLDYETILIEQALAIANDTLEEFITNLLK